MRQSLKLLPLVAAASLALSGVALAKTVTLTGNFIVENGARSIVKGNVKATLNTTTDLVRYAITYGGLSGPVKAAHFHGPAAAGVEAGVLVPIPGPYHSGMTGQVKVSAAVAQDMEAGQTYVNLHTAAEPNGEARAQLAAK